MHTLMTEKLKNFLIVALIFVIIGLAATLVYVKYNTTVASATTTNKPVNITIYVIPDYGGSGYDAFVLASNFNGTVPTHATNNTPPGYVNNTIVVPANVPVKFTIINLDTMVFNITTKVTVPFTVINDTNNGQLATTYNVGMQLINFPASHTFTIEQLNINIPIPPSTIVTFTYTFTQPGQYIYHCLTPCGPGMGFFGYMDGYLIVK